MIAERPCKNQRRKKVLNNFMNASMATAALAFLMPLTAQAADPGFCRGYADAAINQVRAALANPACARGIQGNRWSPEHRVHFDWCLTQPIPGVEAERGARTAYLRSCRGM
jgi:hypothetical protein